MVLKRIDAGEIVKCSSEMGSAMSVADVLLEGG